MTVSNIGIASILSDPFGKTATEIMSYLLEHTSESMDEKAVRKLIKKEQKQNPMKSLKLSKVTISKRIRLKNSNWLVPIWIILMIWLPKQKWNFMFVSSLIMSLLNLFPLCLAWPNSAPRLYWQKSVSTWISLTMWNISAPGVGFHRLTTNLPARKIRPYCKSWCLFETYDGSVCSCSDQKQKGTLLCNQIWANQETSWS